jgi:hypothetical protein
MGAVYRRAPGSQDSKDFKDTKDDKDIHGDIFFHVLVVLGVLDVLFPGKAQGAKLQKSYRGRGEAA